MLYTAAKIKSMKKMLDIYHWFKMKRQIVISKIDRICWLMKVGMDSQYNKKTIKSRYVTSLAVQLEGLHAS